LIAKKLTKKWLHIYLYATYNHNMRITRQAYNEIHSSIWSEKAETWWMLLSKNNSGIIDGFIFDTNTANTWSQYSPDVNFLNAQLSIAEARGFAFVGIVHSHPHGIIRPSSPDIAASIKNMRTNPHIVEYLLPIVQSEPTSGKFELHPYVVTRQWIVKSQVLDIIEPTNNYYPFWWWDRYKTTTQNPFWSWIQNPFGP
jgi:proteasome lid subunit RPN8/RPN11